MNKRLHHKDSGKEIKLFTLDFRVPIKYRVLLVCIL
jgi:hypothetical protein